MWGRGLQSISVLLPEVVDYRKFVRQDLRFAVVGFGKMGMVHGGILNLLEPGCVRAIVEKSHLILFGASRLIKSVSFYGSIDRMLDKEDPDVVYVTTPAYSHYGIVSRLLEAGVENIFVEKPPTVDSLELHSLIDEIGRSQTVMVGLQKRFALPLRHARRLLSEGVVGDVEKVSAYIKSSDIASRTTRFDSIGRGVLLDLGIHVIDLLTWIFEIEGVEASRHRKIYTGVDDYFECELKTANGVRIFVETTWSSSGQRIPETYIEVAGSNGMLRFTEDYLEAELLEKHPSLGDEVRMALYKPHYYRSMPPVNLGSQEFTLEALHFLHSIYSSTKPLTSLKGVSKTMNLIDELYRKANN